MATHRNAAIRLNWIGNVTTNALIANLALECVLHCLMFKGVLFQICVASCMNDLWLAFVIGASFKWPLVTALVWATSSILANTLIYYRLGMCIQIYLWYQSQVTIVWNTRGTGNMYTQQTVFQLTLTLLCTFFIGHKGKLIWN